MLHTEQKITYLQDYREPDYWIESVDLQIDLDEEFTVVTSWLAIVRNTAIHPGGTVPLRLDGRHLTLKFIALDGEPLQAGDYQLQDDYLLITHVPERCFLEIQTVIQPQLNTLLTGLYRSNGIFCTQCEAQGFRHITYFIDRPDVLSHYTVTITADKKRYPVLLSNGNPIESGDLEGGRHWVKWHDPFRKPCYLFALVAGDLACVVDKFVTQSGREVALKIFVEKGNEQKCDHAMQCLKRAMRWDEVVYGLEYDLAIYMIVAVNDFNMGAMENKGLNIFNAQYILADAKTATDNDYLAIESVIGHEYFHNWSGNRVTCRDWFQLSLKEGLTIFRDEEFTADMTSRSVTRIRNVRTLRHHQFREDAGPMAHPVRPDAYVEIRNFYTSTIYQKGAEIIRMMRILLGHDTFHRGMDLYFQRHDGQAVTIDDFMKAMQVVSDIDLSQFALWYSQAGTPVVRVSTDYNTNARTLTLTVRQQCAATPGQPEKKPLHIPLVMGLLDSQFHEMPLQLQGEVFPSEQKERVISITQSEESFCFINVPEKPVPSLMRRFSAPVILRTDLSDQDLVFLLTHDKDGYNRWEAGQQFAVKVLLKLIQDYQQGIPLKLDPYFIVAFRSLLQEHTIDPALLTELLIFPEESYLGEFQSVFDVVATYETRCFVQRELAKQLHDCFFERYQENHYLASEHFEYEIAARRGLKNICLSYLALLDDVVVRDLCFYQFNHATNMTDVTAALIALSDMDCPERVQALSSFYETWRADPLVINKWFAIQAGSKLPDTLAQVKALTQHTAFNLKNPNKVRALIGSFSYHNMMRFHDAKGEGYQFLAEFTLKIDAINPQLAARLVEPLIHWKRFDPQRQQLMREQLQHIAQYPRLSQDVNEIVSKALS